MWLTYNQFYLAYNIYRILHELTFNIKFYEMSSGMLIQASGELYNLSGTSFIKVSNVKKRQGTYFFITMHRPAAGHWFLACRFLGYIRIVSNKDIHRGFIGLKTRLIM